tara:strand:+ start:1307 stop:1582 length:276 start_codon:yes stop_codon:yes gene_type:complete
MNLSLLDEALINDIILYARPTYPYIQELNYICQWFDNEKDGRILDMTKSSWIIDAIDLRNYFSKEFLHNEHKMMGWYLSQYNIDIALNVIE